MSGEPYVVLKRYVPRVWDAKVIGHHLVGYTASLGLIPLADGVQSPINWLRGWSSVVHHAEVRRFTISKPQACEWHKDGDLKAASMMDHGLVLWANRTPTEFKVGDTIFQPAPFDVIYVNNLDCLHRRPLDAPRRRWMFRQRVVKEAL